MKSFVSCAFMAVFAAILVSSSPSAVGSPGDSALTSRYVVASFAAPESTQDAGGVEPMVKFMALHPELRVVSQMTTSFRGCTVGFVVTFEILPDVGLQDPNAYVNARFKIKASKEDLALSTATRSMFWDPKTSMDSLGRIVFLRDGVLYVTTNRSQVDTIRAWLLKANVLVGAPEQ